MASARVPSSVPDVAGTTRMVNSGYWSGILRAGAIPQVGVLLARHPAAAQLTAVLLDGLTIARLVAIADALYNRCRVSKMEAVAPGDPIRQAGLAWQALLAGADKVYRQPSGWTGAARLLEAGQREGLAAASGLDVGALARVGARIVSGPYSEANARGIR